MATWNAAIPDHDTTVFTDVQWLTHLNNAVNQRLALYSSWYLGVPTSGSVPPDVNVGDDVQGAGYWAALQSSVTGMLEGAWVRTDTPIDPATGFVYWTEKDLRTYLGLINSDFRGPTSEIALWRRKRPREVADQTQTQDVFANVLADGMIAWLLDTSALMRRASGAWTPALATDTPDVLDSNNPASGTSFMGSGLMQPGDYLGPWILTELRSVLNEVVWIPDQFPTMGTATAYTATASNSDMASAEAAADAAYGSGPTSAAADFTCAAVKYLDGYHLTANVGTTTTTAQSGDPVLGCAVEADFYVYPNILQNNASRLAPFPITAWDTQGISWLVQNQWCKWITLGPATGALSTPAWPTSLPPDWLAPTNWPSSGSGGAPAPGGFAGAGYAFGQNPSSSASDIIAVVRYDVTGGLAETAASP